MLILLGHGECEILESNRVWSFVTVRRSGRSPAAMYELELKGRATTLGKPRNVPCLGLHSTETRHANFLFVHLIRSVDMIERTGGQNCVSTHTNRNMYGIYQVYR